MYQNYWACVLEPGNQGYGGPHALQPVLPSRRSLCTSSGEDPHALPLEKSPSCQEDTAQPKISVNKSLKKNKTSDFHCRGRMLSSRLRN